MATVTNGVATASTTNATSYASGSFTPTAGDLVLVFVTVSGNVVIPQMTDSQNLGFDYVGSAFYATNANTVHLFVANQKAANSAMTVTFTCVGTTASGAVVNPVLISGQTKFGSFAIKQFKASSNNAAASSTAIAFGATTTAGNPILGVIGNATNPATMTPPTGYTELADTGYATPTIGHESVALAAGATVTTITWGSNSASTWGGIIVEIDASNTGWTILQSKLANKTVGTGTTATAAMATTTTGSMLTAFGVTDLGSASSITGIAATGTANWTKKGDINDGGGASESGWYGYNTTSSATPTLTVTFAASVIGQVFINEYAYYNAGVVVPITTDPFNTIKTAIGGPSTAPATGNTASVPAGSLLVAGAGTLDSANRYSPGTGYLGASGHQTGTTLDGGFEDGVAATTAVQSAGFTITASDDWGTMIMVFNVPSSGTSTTVTQVAANLTATGGTQAVASVSSVSIAQVAANLTATGGTQAVAAVVIASASITQVAANLTATGGVQAVATVQIVAISQSHATLTATGGVQAVLSVSMVAINQVAANLTATGGTQLIKTAAAIAQVAANLTVAPGTQGISSVQIVNISQTHATLSVTGGTQAVLAAFTVNIAQVAATLAVTGGVQAVVAAALVSASISQVAALIRALGGTQAVFAFTPPHFIPIKGTLDTTSKGSTLDSTSKLAQLSGGVTLEDISTTTKKEDLQTSETHSTNQTGATKGTN